MVYINLIVLGGYAFFGVMLLMGFLLNIGSLVVLPVVFGWFLVFYSAAAYGLLAILQLYRREHRFFTTLYPVNFSLALGAFLLFGIKDMAIVMPLLVSAVLGAGTGLLVRYFSLAVMTLLPFISLVPLFLCLLPSVGQYWMPIFSFIASFLLVSYVGVHLTRRMVT